MYAIVCWSGDLADGESALKPLRAFGTPLADWVVHVAYARLTEPMARVGSALRQVQPQLRRPVPAQRQAQPAGPVYNYWKGGSLSELSNASVEQIAVTVAKAPPGCSFGLGHYMHGQACRVAPDATPLTRTAGQVTYFINAGWDDPTRGETSMQWVDDTWGVMNVISGEGAYINYLSSGRPAAVRTSYGANYERLARIKKQYDPSNFFHRNRNIRA
jgi:FAD/FMN-containing dehydrogenase